MSLAIPTHLSFSKTLSSQNPLFISKLSQFSLHTSPIPRKTSIIRMGGGPRTYPGGVSKWQWKRMQAKKAKQLLKARLCRERQIYEMRKRAELKSAVSELERPWEVVERAPTLFSVKADEQVKVLADRFQKPGGFDLWSESDGPQLFETPDGLPSARFFPKGVVHSIRPYGKISNGEEDSALGSESQNDDRFGRDMTRNGHMRNGVSIIGKFRRDGLYSERKDEDADLLGMEDSSDLESGYTKNSAGKWGMDKKTRSKNEDVDLLAMEDASDLESGFSKNSAGKWGTEKKTKRKNGGEFRKQGNRSSRGGLGSLDSGKVGLGRKQRGGDYTKTNRSKMNIRINRINRLQNSRYSKSEVFDMNLEQDGSYGFQAKNQQLHPNSRVPEEFESF